MPEERKRPPLTDEQRRLVEDNLALASWFAHRFGRSGAKGGLTWDEVRACAEDGLMRAAVLYDPARSSFSHYAVLWMRSKLGAACDAFAVVHPPRGRNRERGRVKVCALEACGDIAVPPEPCRLSPYEEVAKLLKVLTEEERIAVEARHLEGLAVHHIARQLGVRYERCKSILASAMHKMRKAASAGEAPC